MGTQMRELKSLLFGAVSMMLLTFFIFNYLDDYLHATPTGKGNKIVIEADTSLPANPNLLRNIVIGAGGYFAGNK